MSQAPAALGLPTTVQRYLDNRAEHEKAISYLIAVIGDRNGLDDLRVLFNEGDADGNGILDLQEFGGILRKLEDSNESNDEEGQAERLTDEDVEGLFSLFDVDGDGTLTFEEFAYAQKAELEWADMRKEFGFGQPDSDVSPEVAKKFEEEQQKVMTAFHNGVRVNRSESVQHNPKLQGNAEMLSLSAVQFRETIKEDQRIIDLMSSWWDGIKIKIDSEDGTHIDKDSYILMSITIHKVLVPDTNMDDARSTAEHDWNTDNQGKDLMDYATFFDSMFELCDTWSDGLDPRAHCNLLGQFQKAHLAAEIVELARQGASGAVEAATAAAAFAASLADKVEELVGKGAREAAEKSAAAAAAALMAAAEIMRLYLEIKTMVEEAVLEAERKRKEEIERKRRAKRLAVQGAACAAVHAAAFAEAVIDRMEKAALSTAFALAAWASVTAADEVERQVQEAEAAVEKAMRERTGRVLAMAARMAAEAAAVAEAAGELAQRIMEELSRQASADAAEAALWAAAAAESGADAVMTTAAIGCAAFVATKAVAAADRAAHKASTAVSKMKCGLALREAALASVTAAAEAERICEAMQNAVDEATASIRKAAAEAAVVAATAAEFASQEVEKVDGALSELFKHAKTTAKNAASIAQEACADAQKASSNAAASVASRVAADASADAEKAYVSAERATAEVAAKQASAVAAAAAADSEQACVRAGEAVDEAEQTEQRANEENARKQKQAEQPEKTEQVEKTQEEPTKKRRKKRVETPPPPESVPKVQGEPDTSARRDTRSEAMKAARRAVEMAQRAAREVKLAYVRALHAWYMASSADLLQPDHVLGHSCSRFRSGGGCCPGCWIMNTLRKEMGKDHTDAELHQLAHEALTGSVTCSFKNNGKQPIAKLKIVTLIDNPAFGTQRTLVEHKEFVGRPLGLDRCDTPLMQSRSNSPSPFFPKVRVPLSARGSKRRGLTNLVGPLAHSGGLLPFFGARSGSGFVDDGSGNGAVQGQDHLPQVQRPLSPRAADERVSPRSGVGATRSLRPSSSSVRQWQPKDSPLMHMPLPVVHASPPTAPSSSSSLGAAGRCSPRSARSPRTRTRRARAQTAHSESRRNSPRMQVLTLSELIAPKPEHSDLTVPSSMTRTHHDMGLSEIEGEINFNWEGTGLLLDRW